MLFMAVFGTHGFLLEDREHAVVYQELLYNLEVATATTDSGNPDE